MQALLKFSLLRVMLLSIWKRLRLYQICNVFLFIVVTPYINVQSFFRTLLFFMTSYGNEWYMNKQKTPLLSAHTAFAAFQAP